jgi:hypothetical protein
LRRYSALAGCGEYMKGQRDGCDCQDGHVPGALPPAPAQDPGTGTDDTADGQTDETYNADNGGARELLSKIRTDSEANKSVEEEEEKEEEEVPKMVIPRGKAIPAGKYCASLNLMGMFDVAVNLDVQAGASTIVHFSAQPEPFLVTEPLKLPSMSLKRCLR